MNKTGITYGQIEDALLALGYNRDEIPGSHKLFTTNDPVATIMLQPMPSDRTAHPVHVAIVRGILDDAGILSRDEFTDFVQHGGPSAA